jgi:hypothetical protein
MGREFSTERSYPQDRNGAGRARAGNGSGPANGDAGANGQGKAGGRIGASAVVRPVPGGEHKGMLKLVEFTQPANGTVSRNPDQTLTYRPKPGFTGKDSFDYTLCDEAGTTFSATVAVAVTLDVPAGPPVPARTPLLRSLGSPPAPRPANTGEGLPRLDGGPARFPGE